MADTEPIADDAGRHATNLELFLDLAFVFAVAQIASLVASDLTVAGVARGVLVALLAWWLWSQFAWLGTAIDVEGDRRARGFILGVVPVVLLLGVSIPTAYGSGGAKFGLAYLAIQLGALSLQGWSLWADVAARRAWLAYAPVALVAPALVAAGGLVSGTARTTVWVVAAAVSLASALAAGRQRDDAPSEWRIDPTHFAERHALFVIIALGEVLVAASIAAGTVSLEPIIGVGLVAAVSVACVYWWAYFGFLAGACEGALQRATGVERGRVARDVFTFGHFPFVMGIVLYALVAKHAVPAPGDPLGLADRVVLVVSVALFVAAMVALRYRIVRGFAVERPLTAGVVALWCLVAAPHLAAWITVAGVSVALLVMHLVTLRLVSRRVGRAQPVTGS